MLIINMFVLYIFGIKCSFMFIDIAFMCFMESESVQDGELAVFILTGGLCAHYQYYRCMFVLQ